MSFEFFRANTWNRQSVDDVRQIVDAGNWKLQTMVRCFNTVVGEISWSPMLKTTMDCHSELVMRPLRNRQPVQVIIALTVKTTLAHFWVRVISRERTATYWWLCSVHKQTPSCSRPNRPSMRQKHETVSSHCPMIDEHVSADNARYDLYTVSQKSSTSYFAKYFRAGLTDCKNFNGHRVTDNKRTQVCNQCFNF